MVERFNTISLLNHFSQRSKHLFSGIDYKTTFKKNPYVLPILKGLFFAGQVSKDCVTLEKEVAFGEKALGKSLHLILL